MEVLKEAVQCTGMTLQTQVYQCTVFPNLYSATRKSGHLVERVVCVISRLSMCEVNCKSCIALGHCLWF